MSIKKSLYNELILESNDQSRTIDLIGGAILFEYYEDIFSPTITAKIKIVNNGNVITPADGKSGDRQSIYNGLPLRGGERLSLKIAGNSSTNPGLDFSKKSDDYFYVSSITDVISETNRETFTLHLVSRESITNETVRVSKKFKTSLRISDSVENILKESLKTNKIGTIDKSSNKYGFIGNLRKPFTVLVWLASKAVPESSGSATAGFLFYQTQDGFQFRSLDELMLQTPKATYTYTESQESYNENEQKVNNDFKILNYNIDRNQNLLEKLRLGTYANYRIFFNPLTGTITPSGKVVFKQSNYNNKTSNLGKKSFNLPKLNNNSNKTLGDIPTRTITGVLDVGTMEQDISKDLNADPTEYQSQSLMRYNTLFTQTVNMMIPSNTNLRAGDLIECNFPKITQSNAKEFDPETSGLYMIKELCHHFDVENSYTSMKLIRDTFGVNVEVRK
jgi:hypothetical protein